MTGTGTLLRELDRWDAEGLTATIWWRDDDLQRPTPALEPLLAMAEATEWVPGLAVVPEGADMGGLAARLLTGTMRRTVKRSANSRPPARWMTNAGMRARP